MFTPVFYGGTCFWPRRLKTIVAEPGDGILSLLRKQGVEDPYRYYDAFIDLNQEQLRDSVHLYAGREYKIPEIGMPKEDTKKEEWEHTFPILGPDYETVTIKSKRLEGNVYYLVSGHGGPDPGAMAVYKGKSLAEDEYAYDITLRLARELLSHSATVYLIIRDDDGIRNERILPLDRDEVAYPDLEIPLDQVKRLKQRVHIVNKLYKKHKGSYQRLIVTHIDSRSVGQNIDVFFYHHEKSKNGKRLAESIHKTFKAKYKKYQPIVCIPVLLRTAAPSTSYGRPILP